MSNTNPDLAPVADSAVVTQSVPIIDLGGAKGMQDSATAARIAGGIRDACREWCFFQTVNHGVDAEHLDRVSQTIHDFLALPLSAKRALNRSDENPWVISTANCGAVMKTGHKFLHADY